MYFRSTLLDVCTTSPSIFCPGGARAERVATLGWVLTLVSCLVLVVVTTLLLVALFRRRKSAEPALGGVAPFGSGVSWIVIGGVIVPAVVIAASFIFSIVVETAVASPPRRPVARIEVTGHRWWWEVRYAGDASGAAVVTANEIHIPAGQPVQLTLASEDVIHSFWVPELSGKIDLIPGLTNMIWLDARRPGTYRGQCAEYCGLQHAHMAFVVVADPPARFRAWLSAQRATAAAPSDSAARRGLVAFQTATCAACHSIRGTEASGRIGPDLTHVASRSMIAAGTLPNTRGNLAGWIADPQGLKPGSEMPTLMLPPGELTALVAYLETLR